MKRTAQDRVLLGASLCAFAVWISAVGPLRWWAEGTAFRSAWALGVAPNFFAGVTLTWWQAYFTRTGPLASAGYALAVLALGELAQLAMANHTADAWDVAVSVAGVVVAAPVVAWRAGRGLSTGEGD